MLRLPAVLTISPTEPTSASGLAADALTLACMGVYPLCVASEVCLRDTAQVEARVSLECDIVVDQARVVLEDVPVSAMKFTLPGSVAMVSAMAELVADYVETPLVLELPALMVEEDESDDDHLSAALELLVPYATTLVLDPSAGRRLIAAGVADDEPDDLSLEDMAALICGIGCESVLFLGAGGGGPKAVHLLYGEQGILQSIDLEHVGRRTLGFGCSVSSGLAAGLAQGRTLEEATREAIQFAHKSEASALHMGMGALVPDRMFWARPDEEAS